LICFDKLALVAVSSEPAYPMKIKLDRAPRKMASPPQRHNRTFAVITTFQIHAILTGRRLEHYQEIIELKAAIDGLGKPCSG